jgi:hypothetical protein
MDSNCAEAYNSSEDNNTASGWLASSVTFSSVDIAIAACP